MTKKKTTTEKELTGFMDTPEWEIPQIKGLKDIKAVMFYEYSMADKNYLIKKGLIEDNHQATKEWMELRTQAITLSAKIESAKTPTKRDKLLEEQDSLYTKTATIPLPLTEMGENTLTTYATLFNFYYQLTGYKGSLGKFLDKHPIIRLPGVISVFYFIETYIDEIAIPINNNTKALFFNFLKDGTFTTLSIEQNNGLFFSLIADNQKSITAKIFFSLNEADHLNLWQITDFDERIAFLKSKASTKQEKEAIDKEYKAILAKENPFTLILQDLKDLKNPYTITPKTNRGDKYSYTTNQLHKGLIERQGNEIAINFNGYVYTATPLNFAPRQRINYTALRSAITNSGEAFSLSESKPLKLSLEQIKAEITGDTLTKAIKIENIIKKGKDGKDDKKDKENITSDKELFLDMLAFSNLRLPVVTNRRAYKPPKEKKKEKEWQANLFKDTEKEIAEITETTTELQTIFNITPVFTTSTATDKKGQEIETKTNIHFLITKVATPILNDLKNKQITSYPKCLYNSEFLEFTQKSKTRIYNTIEQATFRRELLYYLDMKYRETKGKFFNFLYEEFYNKLPKPKGWAEIDKTEKRRFTIQIFEYLEQLKPYIEKQHSDLVEQHPFLVMILKESYKQKGNILYIYNKENGRKIDGLQFATFKKG